MSTGSSLLSPAEALAFHGFLTSVDYGDALEWRDLTSSLQPPRGKEALAKATKDLMSLEASVDLGYSSHSSNAARETLAMGNMGVSTQDILSSSSSKGKSAVGASSTWPSFGPNDPGPQQQQQKQSYTYGFGVQPHDYRPSAAASSSSSRIHDNFLLPNSSSAASGSTTLPFPLPHSHSESSLRHHPSNRPSSPSIFSLPSSTHQQPSNSSTGRSFNDRPPSISASSAPSVLEINTGSKRSLPPDEDDLNSPSSSATSTQGNSQTTANKRRRSSAVDTKPLVASAPSPSDSQQNGSGSRQALLSPSQKRANHIQSEQKRRANIRRGYEALCEVVPALREAIKAEEAASAASAKASSKRKKKGKGSPEVADDPPEKSAMDGRAGPRSENVVLQKTIDHLNSLLTERAELVQRLANARARLAPGHPALAISPQHLDPERGVPLWEREWNGGSGWGVDADPEE